MNQSAEEVLEALQQVCYGAGQLLGVEHATLEGDPYWVTAVRLRFESVAVTFRATGDDTLQVVSSSLATESDEVIVPATGSSPWAGCVGRRVSWAWVLTNQQEYTDGARLEFRSPGQPDGRVVEMVVLGSAIRLFAASEARPPEAT